MPNVIIKYYIKLLTCQPLRRSNHHYRIHSTPSYRRSDSKGFRMLRKRASLVTIRYCARHRLIASNRILYAFLKTLFINIYYNNHMI